LIEWHLDKEVSMEGVRNALMAKGRDCGSLVNVLRDVLGCSNVMTTPWMNSSSGNGSMIVQRSQYVMPMPDDIPTAALKILRLPSTIPGTTLSYLTQAGKALTLVQHCCSEGVLYSDQFYVEFTHAFHEGLDGLVHWRQWTRVIWTKPLPWGHGFIRRLLESRTKSEAKATAKDFVAILQRDASTKYD
jgi:hypothetical protein